MGDGSASLQEATLTVTELLTAVRPPYADLLSLAANAQESCVEPGCRSSDGMLATEGIWERPCRADVIRVSKDTTEAVQVDSQHDLDGMKKPQQAAVFQHPAHGAGDSDQDQILAVAMY